MKFELYKKISDRESFFFFSGWVLIGFLATLGNTSLGLLFLLIHTIYLIGKNRELPYRYQNKVENFIWLFISWGIISSIFAANKSIALLTLTGYILLLYIMFMGSGKLLEYTHFIKKIIIPVFIYGISVSSIYTILNYYIYSPERSKTFFTGINGTGTILSFAIIFLVGYFDSLQNKKKYLLFLPIFLSVVALLLTFSRGAWLGFITSFSIYNLRSRKNILILIIVILVLASIISFTPKFRERFLSIFSTSSNQGRILLWKSTLKMIRDHPLLGIGPGNYQFVFNNYRLPEERDESHPFSHNIFSNMAAETGLIGLFLFSIIIYFVIKSGFVISKINPLYRGLWAGFTGMLVHQQFDCTILGMEIGGLFWITAGLIMAIYYKINTKDS